MKFLVLFLSSICFATLTNSDSRGERNLIQISYANSDENSSIRALKAFFIPCTSKTSKCISRVEVQGLLNANKKRETFLLIDEVFDLKERAHLPLLHPYLIQVSATETIASFPLHFEQYVDVSCSGNDVQRRATYHEDFPFTAEQLHSYDDLLNDIIITSKNEANAIKKKDIRNFMSDNRAASAASRQHDLLLYFDNDDIETTTKPQTVDMKSQSGNLRKIQIENLLKSYENVKFSNSPQTDANNHNKNHEMAKIENRFSINQDKNGDEVERSTGVINHHYHGQENDAKSSKHLPDEIDIRLRFNHGKNSRRAIDAADIHKSELGRNHKFSSDDNREFFIAYDNREQLKQRQNNDFYYHDDDDGNQFEPIDIEDDPNMLTDTADASFTNNLHKAANAVQKDAISKSKFKRNEVEISHKDEIKLRLSKDDDEMKKKEEAQRYSVYSLDEPTYNRSSMKIQIFRMYNQTWIKVQPSIVIANETIANSSNVQNENSMRKTFSQTLDHNHAKLLVLNNEPSLSSSSIMEYQNESKEKFSDAVEKSICTRNDVMMKRSIIKLNEAGVMLSDNDDVDGDGRRAITQCPSNVNQLCLNIKELEDAWRLNVVIPFQHNELLDKRSPFVKISNIYIDTSDNDELFTQFEITSMDHFTQQFNLSFGNCEMLERLNNVSHTFTLSPNKSKLINMTFPLPFSPERKDQKCKVNISSGKKIIAQREFPISSSEKRCLCLWMCSCFCFDSFLSTGIKDLCHIMSAKNEIYAGFYDEQNFEEMEEELDGWTYWKKILIFMPLAIILFVLLMGCIKAILGCCYKSIDSWKFNHVQSCVSYRESRRCWKVFVNIMFFFLLPIACCMRCSCCLYEENSETSVFGRSIVRKEIYSDDDYDSDDDDDKTGNDEENWKLLKPNAPSSDYSTIFEHYNRSSETIFNVSNLRNPFDEKKKQQQQQQPDEDEMLVKDTEYVVSAINESHESLRKLSSHHSEENIENDERFEAAQRLVKEFLAARIVYRRFDQAIGNVKINDSQSYSIRGYFVPAQSTGYQFITYNPIKQFYQVSTSLILVTLAPQIQLDSKAFRRYYANKIEVLEANDLSLKPSPSAPCINVLVQDKSMYGS